MDNVTPFVKDRSFESVLSDVNEALNPLELQYISRFDRPKYPIVFIAGTQRSGTTLLMQLMLSYFNIGYVSNVMARFWCAPYIGALLFRELRRKSQRQYAAFTSELGTTYGYEGPHEFGYFWQHWFPYGETHQLAEETLEAVDVALFRKELAAMESVFDAPLVFKNPVIASLNMVALADILPTALFIICHRDPIYVAQSTLAARLKFYGDKSEWWSMKPKEYTWLRKLPYYEQIAGQIFFTEQRISRSISKINSQHYLEIEYEDLCAHPERVLTRIKELVNSIGYNLTCTGYKPKSFQSANKQRISDSEFDLLNQALDRFYNSRIP